MRKHWIFYVSAFVTGASVMAVEMSSTRLLAPYFGNSLYVWTNVIGLILLALSGGYFYGGRLADKHPKSSLYFSLISVTGLWILLVPFVFKPFFTLLLELPNLEAVVRLGSFFAVLILFTVPIFLMGIIVPFTVKMVVEKLGTLGTEAGKVSTVSTVGSLLGTFLPAFVLIPSFGTTKTFVVIGFVLLVLAAVGLRKIWSAVFALLAIAFYFFVPPVFAAEDALITRDSPYGFIFVTEEEDGLRKLHIDNGFGTQSIYDPEEMLFKNYYYSYFGALPALISQPQKVLILGHAAGSITRIYNEFFPELSVTGVELDPAVSEVAMESMGLSELNVEIVHADARSFLLTTEENFDLIVIDTYRGAVIPAHLSTQEFFSLVAKKLSPGGLVALNVAAAESEFLSVLKNTLASQFQNIFSVPIPGSFNEMIVASPEEFSSVDIVPRDLESYLSYIKQNEEGLLYDPSLETFTDDKSGRVELLSEAMLFSLMNGR